MENWARRHDRSLRSEVLNRGGPVSACDHQTRSTIDQLADEIDVEGLVEVWEAALAAEWSGPDVWVDGDVAGSK